MAEFVVNVTLIVALFALLLVWAVSAARRRRRDRREHAQERRLILGAFTAAAGGAPRTRDDVDEDLDDDLEADPENDTRVQLAQQQSVRRTRSQPPTRSGARRPVATAAQQLDPASIVALLDLLEDRKPARRGVVASFFTSPGSVWSAGTRAGQSIARNTMGDPDARDRTDDPAGAQLYRDAAGELVDIYAHDPADARDQYAAYAAALGDPALAELYVRSAAYATYADHDEVANVVDDITRGNHGQELSDDAASIDT